MIYPDNFKSNRVANGGIKPTIEVITHSIYTAAVNARKS